MGVSDETEKVNESVGWRGVMVETKKSCWRAGGACCCVEDEQEEQDKR